MVELILLDDKQKAEALELYKIYRFVYLCNKCGSLYGADKHEKKVLCPLCEIKLSKKKEVK